MPAQFVVVSTPSLVFLPDFVRLGNRFAFRHFAHAAVVRAPRTCPGDAGRFCRPFIDTIQIVRYYIQVRSNRAKGFGMCKTIGLSASAEEGKPSDCLVEVGLTVVLCDG